MKITGIPKIVGELSVEMTVTLERVDHDAFGRPRAVLSVATEKGLQSKALSERDSLTLIFQVVATNERSAPTVTEALQVIKEALK